jgi:hypothetical protein
MVMITLKMDVEAFPFLSSLISTTTQWHNIPAPAIKILCWFYTRNMIAVLGIVVLVAVLFHLCLHADSLGYSSRGAVDQGIQVIMFFFVTQRIFSEGMALTSIKG